MASLWVIMNLSIEFANSEDVLILIEVQNRSFYDDYLMYGECLTYNESEAAMKEYINS